MYKCDVISERSGFAPADLIWDVIDCWFDHPSESQHAMPMFERFAFCSVGERIFMKSAAWVPLESMPA